MHDTCKATTHRKERGKLLVTNRPVGAGGVGRCTRAIHRCKHSKHLRSTCCVLSGDALLGSGDTVRKR